MYHAMVEPTLLSLGRGPPIIKLQVEDAPRNLNSGEGVPRKLNFRGFVPLRAIPFFGGQPPHVLFLVWTPPQTFWFLVSPPPSGYQNTSNGIALIPFKRNLDYCNRTFLIPFIPIAH